MNFIRSIKKMGALKMAVFLFAVLALFILIVEKPGSTSLEKVEESYSLFFPRLRPELVTHVVITRPGEAEISLRKTEEGWDQKDGTLLNSVLDLKNTGLVSRNPSKQALFGVDEAQGIHFKLWRNTRELANFYIGKPAGLNRQYIRLEGKDEVMEAAPMLPAF